MLDPHDVLALLLEGNQRWVRGELEHPRQTVQRRKEVASHQDPFAVVFSCIDSRVPPEIVFDCGIGDLFVIRTGGEALDDLVVLGSPEFGPSGYSSTRLIGVLRHRRDRVHPERHPSARPHLRGGRRLATRARGGGGATG